MKEASSAGYGFIYSSSSSKSKSSKEEDKDTGKTKFTMTTSTNAPHVVAWVSTAVPLLPVPNQPGLETKGDNWVKSCQYWSDVTVQG
ncbi:MAG: hypothetical protein MHM6MM_009299 [Cercozoa sp. M6MM]